MPVVAHEAIRCTLPSCSCDCYTPGKSYLRTCEGCKHGWVVHALDKLAYNNLYPLGMQVEIVQPNIVFDIASLMLYGAQATPIRLKILLDRLFSVLQHEEVLQVLHSFGWSYEDYARGYILQVDDRNGRVLDKWSIASREEEQIILQQFLRFGETKSIAQEIILQDTKERQEVYYRHSPRTESDIKKFIERSSLQMQSFMRSYETQRQQQQALLKSTHPAHIPTTTSTPRLLSPNGTHSFSSSSANSPRESRSLNLPNSNMSPVSHSPLNRLQTMQPYDMKREVVSPHVSPVSAAEKRSASIPPCTSPISLPHRPMPGLLSMTSSLPDPRAIISSRIQQQQQQQPEDLSKNGSKTSSSPMIVTKEPHLHPELDRDRPSMALNFAKMSMPARQPVIPSSMSNGFNSLYAERKIKHLRKSANPIKRNWTNTPVTAYGGSLIGPTGKKRVLCTACNKTFCDKGALKIHYSAVHLKEMHSCTVEGCNMLFSSRRSRNRHSANPNPKLHRPMKQKLPDGARIVDDGGKPHMIGNGSDVPTMAPQLLSPTMSAHGLPGFIHAPSPITAISSVAHAMVEPPRASSVPHLHHQHTDGTNPYFIDTMERYTLVEPSMKKPRLDLSDDDDVGFDPTIDDDDDDDDDEEIVVSEDTNNLSIEGAVPTTNDERIVEPVVRSTSKRKSQVPVRCKQTEEVFEISDENSDDNPAGIKGTLALGLNESADLKSTSEEVPPLESSNQENMNMDVDTDPDSHRTTPIDMHVMAADSKNSPVDTKLPHDANFNTEKLDASESQQIMKECESKAESVDSGVVSDKNFPAVSSNQPVFPDMDPENSPHREINVDNLSDGESNASYGSNESGAHFSENGDGKSIFEIPVDKENPRRCVACGKVFQNHFTVKTHYQNVHLKLMHTCTIEGCNAAFPSKRSRDRHSGNLNLHRKLLSTAEQNEDNIPDANNDTTETCPAKEADGQDEESVKINGSLSTPEQRSRIDVRAQLLETLSLKSFLACPPEQQSDDSSMMNSSDGTSFPPQNAGNQNLVDCHLCKEKFRDNLVLKEHCEKIHPKEMYYCTVGGCDKMFSTRKSRNRHSQNDNLHRHLGDAPSCTQ